MSAIVTARTAILQFLLAGEAYGKEVIAGILGATGIALNDGAVYPALSELELDKLAQSRLVAPPVNRRGQSRTRRYYTLTETGRAEALAIRGQLLAVIAMSRAKRKETR